MAQKLVCLILISGAILLLSGCSKDEDSTGGIFNPPGGSTIAAYLPLKIGNTWNFQWVQWTIPADTTAGTYSFTVDDTAAVFGGAIAYHTQGDGWLGNNWVVVINGEIRVYGGGNPPVETSNYYLWIKEPIQVGTTWFTNYPVQPDSAQSQITSINAAVNVPGGNFNNCVQVSYSATAADYFTTGVGFIQYVSEGASFHYEEELVSYTVQ